MDQGRSRNVTRIYSSAGRAKQQAALQTAAKSQHRAAIKKGVVEWHQWAQEEVKRRREQEITNRLTALRSSDMGAYVKMIK